MFSLFTGLAEQTIVLKMLRLEFGVKYRVTPVGWEYNSLPNQLTRPLHDTRTVLLLNKQFSADIDSVEEIR